MRVRVSSASLEDTLRFKKGLDSVPSVLPADARELEAPPSPPAQNEVTTTRVSEPSFSAA